MKYLCFVLFSQVPIWIPPLIMAEHFFRFIMPIVLSPDIKYMIGIGVLLLGVLIYAGIVYRKTEVRIMRKYSILRDFGQILIFIRQFKIFL